VGSFYVNVTLLGRDLDAVRPVAPRPAFAFTEGDSVVLFTEEDDEGDPKSGEGLSAALGCIAFSAGVHDDDIFFFEVHDRGRSVLHGAVPDPMEFFGIDAEMVADFDRSVVDEVGGTLPGGTPDANALVEAIGRGEPSAVRAALEGEYVLATERHQAMVEALGLPAGAVGWGYRYLARDSSGYSGPRLSRLGGDPGSRQRVEELPACVVRASDVERVVGSRVVTVEFDPKPRGAPVESPDVSWRLCTFETELGQRVMIYRGRSTTQIGLPDWVRRCEVHVHPSSARVYVQWLRWPPIKDRVIRNVYILGGSRAVSIHQTVGGLGIARDYETLAPLIDRIVEHLADPEMPSDSSTRHRYS
jgi:hypothetical protein